MNHHQLSNAFHLVTLEGDYFIRKIYCSGVSLRRRDGHNVVVFHLSTTEERSMDFWGSASDRHLTLKDFAQGNEDLFKNLGLQEFVVKAAREVINAFTQTSKVSTALSSL